MTKLHKRIICLNNPVKYTDPTGHWSFMDDGVGDTPNYDGSYGYWKDPPSNDIDHPVSKPTVPKSEPKQAVPQPQPDNNIYIGNNPSNYQNYPGEFYAVWNSKKLESLYSTINYPIRTTSI